LHGWAWSEGPGPDVRTLSCCGLLDCNVLPVLGHHRVMPVLRHHRELLSGRSGLLHSYAGQRKRACSGKMLGFRLS
jgi:hypothetical protein